MWANVFVGAVPRPLAQAIAQGCAEEKVPLVIGCSGAFTIERCMIGRGLPVFSNDISLFSTAIARAALEPDASPLAKPLEPHLEPHCTTALDLAVTLDVLSGNYSTRDLAMDWARRDALWQQFPDLHAKTKSRIAPTLHGLGQIMAAYTCGDISDHFAQYGATDTSLFCFMPTYTGGYDKIWAPLESLFEWPRPDVPVLDEARRYSIAESMRDHGRYVYLDDSDERGERLGMREAIRFRRFGKHTMYVYSDFLPPSVIGEFDDKTGTALRLASTFAPADPVALTILDDAQAKYVRRALTHARVGHQADSARGGIAHFGVVTDQGLIGAFGLCAHVHGVFYSRSVYMLYDIALPGLHPRLSKLVPMLALSREALAAAAHHLKLVAPMEVQTTAFTDKPVSMKYRGAFDLVDRLPNGLQYAGKASNLSVSETQELWRKKYVRS